MERIVNEKGECYEFAFNEEGKLLSERGLDGSLRRYIYDLDSNWVGVELPNGETVRFVRDLAGKMVTCILPDGTEAGYEYDACGNLVAAVNPTCEVRLERDAMGACCKSHRAMTSFTQRMTWLATPYPSATRSAARSGTGSTPTGDS